MRVHIAADHAGFELKEALAAHLADQGIEVTDHGAFAYDDMDDYPPMCISAAQAVVQDQARGEEALGIVIGGSGNGEQMAANLVDGARVALIWNEETAALARTHNDANVAAIGARQHPLDEALHLADVFVETPYPHEQRHQRRLDMMTDYEAARCEER